MEILMHILFFSLMAWCGYMLFRNNQVHDYRTTINNKVSNAARRDIQEGKPWEWRYEALEAVTYHKMFTEFWRDLDEFYPDKSFMR